MSFVFKLGLIAVKKKLTVTGNFSCSLAAVQRLLILLILNCLQLKPMELKQTQWNFGPEPGTTVLPHLLLWAVYLPLLSFSHASFQSSFFLFSLVFEVVFLSVVDCLPFILFLIIVIICLCLSKNNKSLIKKTLLWPQSCIRLNLRLTLWQQQSKQKEQSQVFQKLVWLSTGVIKAKLWKCMHFLSRQQRYIVVASRFCAAYMDINTINSFKLTVISLALNWYLNETSAHFTPCCSVKSTERPWLGFLSLVDNDWKPAENYKNGCNLDLAEVKVR